ncbi:MAG: DUF4445 domain-containing protein [Candidatus Thorarchaeota archaeon]|nr:DUF4445 domain-containing protein [Candidatus Thorarchaeota archaeon]
MGKNVFVFEPSGLRIRVSDNVTVFEAARLLGLALPSECGGRGTCGKCVVEIQPMTTPTSSDEALLVKEELKEGIRLACMARPSASARITIPQPSGSTKILLDGRSSRGFEVDEGLGGQFGVALDIGTTTIAAYLLSLEDGTQIAQAASLNPQVAYGEDVMSRITYALQETGGEQTLHLLVLSEAEKLIDRMAVAAEINSENVTRLSIVGNPAMHHFFLGLDTSSLGRAPYRPVVKESITKMGGNIGISRARDAEVFFAPNIAGFVGGDTAAFIISQQLHSTDDIVLGIDIGTNGEIVLSKRGEIFCCSAAAGSAFEGATIRHGMRGQVGAIEYVSITDPSNAPDLSVIGNVEPLGICGSGIVDLVSELLRVGILNESGKVVKDSRIATTDDGLLAYMLVDKGEIGSDRLILFTQKDVRQVQLAKGAILAGAAILMSAAEVELSGIDSLYLAGAFGNYIRPRSAIAIGLLPPIDEQRVVPVGNAAGEGAKKLLLSKKERQILDEVVRNINYVELASREDFSSVFSIATLLRRSMPV